MKFMNSMVVYSVIYMQDKLCQRARVIYVDMQLNYVEMQLNYVYMHYIIIFMLTCDIYFDMQQNYLNMQHI